MPLMNIFTGKELGPDDWSGKKTVKTGQHVRSVATTASSVGTENALPSSSEPGFLSPVLASRKNSGCSGAGSSLDVSSDDNSTTVVNEGRFVEPEPVVVSDSEDGDIDGLDDFSLEGYGGCLDCNDIIVDVDDSPEYIDSEAIDYWKRVKANRKRSLTRKPSTHSLSNIERVTEENDNTQIEVVHDVKIKANPMPPSEDGKDPEPTKSRHFLRMVKPFPKNQRSSKHDTAVEEPTTPTTGVNETCDEEVVAISESSECYEVEAQLPPKNRLSSLVKMLSKSKLIYRDTKDVAIEHSCASSTEDRWEKYSDKYKLPDESVSSGMPLELEDGKQEDSNEEDEEGFEDDTNAEEGKAEELKDVVDVLPGHASGQNNLIRSYQSSSSKLRKSIWHKSVKGGSAVAARAMRSRASLVRIAQSMKFNPDELSDGSRSSSGDRGVMRRKDSFFQRARKSAKLRRLGRSMKRGVSRIRKFGKHKSRSEPNLVVCIDGKGDRLGPSRKRSSNVTPDNSETRSDTDPDQESQSGDSFESYDDVVVEVDGPVVLELCLPVMGTNLKPLVYDDEINSICSSTQSEVRTVNTDWYLARTATLNQGSGSAARGACDKSEDGLSRLGIEAPFVVTQDGFRGGESDNFSVASDTDSDTSDSASESSEGDLNTLSTGSDDDSIMYELFPADSFSSLTGIKCNDGCARLSSKDVTSSEMIRTAQVLVRGRSRVRSHGRHSNKIRVGMRDGSKCEKQAKGDEEEDSIIECIAEDAQGRSLPSKVREALFQ